jgi:hypothetical protein
MQKVQSYLYPNRVILIADLAGFTVENTIVYAKTVKMYRGVDNVIQFDIQNADQKRLELSTGPLLTNIKLNVMDAGGKALANSPYTVTPLAGIKGIGTATIHSADLADVGQQFLKYTVTATDTSSNTIPLYTDSRFSAIGTIEIVGNATPAARNAVVYDEFIGDINFMGNVTNHTPAIPCKFYEAQATRYMNFEVYLKNFIGTVYLEATEQMTISLSAFQNAPRLQSFTCSVATTQTLTFTNVPVVSTGGQYNYMRVSWLYPDIWQYGSQQNPTTKYGSITKVVVTS